MRYLNCFASFRWKQLQTKTFAGITLSTSETQGCIILCTSVCIGVFACSMFLAASCLFVLAFSFVLLRLVISITTNLIYMNSVLISYVTHRLNILYTLRWTFTRDTKSVKSKNDEDTWWGFFCDIVIWNHFKMFNMWIYKRKKICDISVVWKPFLPTIIHNSELYLAVLIRKS